MGPVRLVDMERLVHLVGAMRANDYLAMAVLVLVVVLLLGIIGVLGAMVWEVLR